MITIKIKWQLTRDKTKKKMGKSEKSLDFYIKNRLKNDRT